MPSIDEEPVYLYPIYLKLYTTLEIMAEHHNQLRRLELRHKIGAR
jgi:hypothetical protein